MLVPFYFMKLCVLLAVVLGVMGGCGGKQSEDLVEMKTLTMPGGQVIRAEVMIRGTDMMRGMMFRRQLSPDRGLLFVHPRPGKYSYWMSNVKVALDIIWLDKERRIVEMSVNTPPCLEADATKCPHYGGKMDSQFALELAGGMAAKYGLLAGQQITF